jgi:gamma-glutamyl-gamma-aminobutyrate hydrolase PuuD
MVKPPKPQSAKAKAAKAKREKIAASDVRERVEESYDRTWNPRTLMESAYPSSKKESDFLTAEEALAAEEQLLGKRGVVNDDTPFRDDEMPEFLQTAVKAGPLVADPFNRPTPVLDALGRTPKERKERKITDSIALGETKIPQRAVTILRDHDLEHPDLYMAIYVAGDWAVRDDEARFARLFSRSGCYKADTIEDADLVIFGGGSDVEPLLYGENNADRFPSTYYDEKRDAADIQIYLQCRNQGTPMMGVCRGAQFLHVMNGGKLYQDIDGHQGSHKAFALREKTLIEKVSSVHHQSCIFNKEMEVLLTTSSTATTRWLDRDRKDTAAKLDIEGFYYRDTGCFGVQGHPEYAGYNKFSVWCLDQISNLFLTSPDFTWEGKRLRMTKEAKDAKEIATQYIENAYNNSTEV